MRISLLLSAALLCASQAHAVDSSAGTGGAQFLKIGTGSARAMALGRAYVALAEGSDSLLSNPAGLAVTQQKEVVYTVMRYVQDFGGAPAPLPTYLAYAHPMGRTVWGMNAAYYKMDGFDVRDAQGLPQPGQDAVVEDAFVSLGMARSFWYEKLFFGGALRVVHESLAGTSHDTLVGDIGLLTKPNNILSLGLSVQNFGSSLENVASVTRLGAAVKLGEFVTTSIELNKSQDSASRVGLGAEFQVPEQYLEVGQLTFRVGYYTTDNLGQNFDDTLKSLRMDRSSGLSFGFGLYTSQAFGYGLGLDYAFVPYGALGTVDQLSLKLKF